MTDEENSIVVPDEELDQINQDEERPRGQLIHAERHFIGPLPPPEILAGYEQFFPGAADRIFKMTETQQSHRMKLETMVVKGNVSRSNLGLVLGFSVAILFAIGGFYLLSIDKEISGWVSLAGAVLPTVLSYRAAQQKQQKELDEHKGDSIEQLRDTNIGKKKKTTD